MTSKPDPRWSCGLSESVFNLVALMDYDISMSSIENEREIQQEVCVEECNVFIYKVERIGFQPVIFIQCVCVCVCVLCTVECVCTGNLCCILNHDSDFFSST